VIAPIVMLALILGTAWSASGSQFLSYRDPSGVMITYPSDWRAASDRPGVVIVAGPRASWGRPAATIAITRSEATALTHLLAAAVRGAGTGQPLRLLGEQRLSSDRLARYYTRGDGPTAQYVMVGMATRASWTVVIVGVDLVRDPMLGLHAQNFQILLSRLNFP
jgi:hypothetical protein